MTVTQQLAAFIQAQNPPVKLCVACSGGMDSLVLLHALCQLQKNIHFTVRALHVNHGLQAQADQWQQHVARHCQDWQVTLQCHTLALKPKPGESIEACARQARYAYFAAQLQADEILLTAHHQDDQLETVLLQLMRGAGPKGLAAMSAIQAFAQGQHARPLLDVARAKLQAYAQAEDLKWVDDHSNQDTRFDRNFLRHAIIPQLKARWPQAAISAGYSAQHCAQTQQLLEAKLAQQLQTLQGRQLGTLSRAGLAAYTALEQRYLLRCWLVQKKLPMPTQAQLAQMLTLITARNDAKAEVCWQGGSMRFYRDDLFAEKADYFVAAPTSTLHWDPSQSLALPAGLGQLRLQHSPQGGLSTQVLKQSLTVCFRQQGEQIRISQSPHTRPLKKWLQEAHIPPWRRQQLPLIYVNGVLAAVADHWVAADFAAPADEPGLAVIFTR